MAHELDTKAMLIDGVPFKQTAAQSGHVDEGATQGLTEAVALSSAKSRRLLIADLFARYDAAYADFEPIETVTVSIDGGAEQTYDRDLKEVQ